MNHRVKTWRRRRWISFVASIFLLLGFVAILILSGGMCVFLRGHSVHRNTSCSPMDRFPCRHLPGFNLNGNAKQLIHTTVLSRASGKPHMAASLCLTPACVHAASELLCMFPFVTPHAFRPKY